MRFSPILALVVLIYSVVEGRVWLPNMPGANGKNSACFNENKESLNALEEIAAGAADEGGSMMVQCGGPTTTQIARGGSKGSEFIAVTDHSVLLQPHNDSLPPQQVSTARCGPHVWHSLSILSHMCLFPLCPLLLGMLPSFLSLCPLSLSGAKAALVASERLTGSLPSVRQRVTSSSPPRPTLRHLVPKASRAKKGITHRSR